MGQLSQVFTKNQSISYFSDILLLLSYIYFFPVYPNYFYPDVFDACQWACSSPGVFNIFDIIYFLIVLHKPLLVYVLYLFIWLSNILLDTFRLFLDPSTPPHDRFLYIYNIPHLEFLPSVDVFF